MQYQISDNVYVKQEGTKTINLLFPLINQQVQYLDDARIDITHQAYIPIHLGGSLIVIPTFFLYLTSIDQTVRIAVRHDRIKEAVRVADFVSI